MDIKTYLEANWHQVKGNVRKNWGKITENEVQAMQGREEELIGALQKHYDLSENQARQDLQRFLEAGSK